VFGVIFVRVDGRSREMSHFQPKSPIKLCKIMQDRWKESEETVRKIVKYYFRFQVTAFCSASGSQSESGLLCGTACAFEYLNLCLCISAILPVCWLASARSGSALVHSFVHFFIGINGDFSHVVLG
jgi:hypothetical protein